MVRNGIRWGRRLAVGAAVPALLAGTALAQACSLDNKPSLTANGMLPILNARPPLSSAERAAYAPFVFRRPFVATRAVTFSEIRSELARSLLPSAMQRPWRWRFGDGATGYGWSVRHIYRHAGPLHLAVDAYDPGTKQWYEFDRVQIRIAT